MDWVLWLQLAATAASIGAACVSVWHASAPRDRALRNDVDDLLNDVERIVNDHKREKMRRVRAGQQESSLRDERPQSMQELKQELRRRATVKANGV